jgi:alginate O-acetyltransferase complex protein AlgI
VLFNSLRFLFVFLPVVYVVFWRLRDKRQRYVWLTLAGYVFYGTWNYKFCALMALSTVVSYCAGLGLLRWDDPRRRRLCLVIPVTFDLALLGVFKYLGFVMLSVAEVARWLKHPLTFAPLSLVLPVGISFYTFHTITYIVDAYRRAITPTRSFFELACYVSLFPQLVAGPIVRFRQIEGDLERIDRADRTAALDEGWSYFAIGLMKKVLLADTIAAIIDPALSAHGALSTLDAWLCVLGYTFQLYFDFSGYSDMAVGLGHLFGVRLPQNFDSPYRALDIADFWRRWHISLSTCLRDYLYIPLGGNRDGASRTYRNLLLTMLLGGLWHGAGWTFVCWGGYHGVLLCLHRAFVEPWTRLPAALRRAATFFAVVIGWLLFRATDFTMARTLLGRMFQLHEAAPMRARAGLLFVLFLSAAVTQLAPNTSELSHRWSVAATAAIALGFVLCLVVLAGGAVSPFLYFQF